MKRVQDIHISDSSLISEYINNFLSGNYNEAFNLLENNSQLENKQVIASLMNTISDLLLNHQNLIYDNINGVLSSDLSIFQNVINNYKYIGEYTSSIVYRIYNYVTYNEKYYMYINKIASSNHLPTNTNYWVEIDLKGEQGAPGLGLTFQYDWKSNFNYRKYDVVYYENCLWVAFKDNYNVVPSEEYISVPVTLIIDQYVENNNNFGDKIITASEISSGGIIDENDLSYGNDAWQVLLRFNKSNIYFEENLPSNLYDGLILFEIFN